MAFKLEEIGGAIFCGKETYLDLDSGRILPCWLVEQGIEALPARRVKLPHYSVTFLPYHYIQALLKADPAAQIFLRDSHSALEALQSVYPRCDEGVYEKLSSEFCKAYAQIIQHTREHSPQEPAAKSPTYPEFSRMVSIKFAQEWCEKHGLKVGAAAKK